ncbi:hypothetical protein QJS04_geneDACA022604 [Acorus gramineus]|uniref:Uncharacterized protein n=1 Tax=Acorus gramineus TaxID=55184 RepID=A0AAV9BUY6_ACOGR|nr:hypothetical protein QJS04_geneDACA022604 [Acorus gramineus]
MMMEGEGFRGVRGGGGDATEVEWKEDWGSERKVHRSQGGNGLLISEARFTFTFFTICNRKGFGKRKSPLYQNSIQSECLILSERCVAARIAYVRYKSKQIRDSASDATMSYDSLLMLSHVAHSSHWEKTKVGYFEKTCYRGSSFVSSTKAIQEQDVFSNGRGRHSKACKQDVEEIKAYRASFEFSADEIISTQNYVATSDAVDISFSVSPFANHKLDAEQCSCPEMINGIEKKQTTESILFNTKGLRSTSKRMANRVDHEAHNCCNRSGDYLSGMSLDEWVAPIPGLPYFTGYVVIIL